jgi:hypothetical protein
MAYGDVVVIDISRNLLLIMSNTQYVAQNNQVMYLLYGKYSGRCASGIALIHNGFSSLHRILSKLFIVSLLGTREHMAEPFFSFGGRALGSTTASRPAPRQVQAGLQITDRDGFFVRFWAPGFRENG